MVGGRWQITSRWEDHVGGCFPVDGLQRADRSSQVPKPYGMQRRCRKAPALLGPGRHGIAGAMAVQVGEPSAASHGAPPHALQTPFGALPVRDLARRRVQRRENLRGKDSLEFTSDVSQMLTHTHLSSSLGLSAFGLVCSPRQPTPSRFPDLVVPLRTAPHAAVTMPSKELPEGASRRPPAAASAEFPRVSMRAQVRSASSR